MYPLSEQHDLSHRPYTQGIKLQIYLNTVKTRHLKLVSFSSWSQWRILWVKHLRESYLLCKGYTKLQWMSPWSHPQFLSNSFFLEFPINGLPQSIFKIGIRTFQCCSTIFNPSDEDFWRQHTLPRERQAYLWLSLLCSLRRVLRLLGSPSNRYWRVVCVQIGALKPTSGYERSNNRPFLIINDRSILIMR